MATRVEFTNNEAITIQNNSDTYGPLVQDDAGQKYIDYIDIIDAQFVDVDVFSLFLDGEGILDKDIQDIKDFAHSQGITEWTGLTDTASSFATKKGNFPVVNPAETALEFLALGYRAVNLGTVSQTINVADEPYSFTGDYLDVCSLSLSDPSSVIDSWSIVSQTAHEIDIIVTSHVTNTGDAEFSVIAPTGDLGVKLIISVGTLPSNIYNLGDPLDIPSLWVNIVDNPPNAVFNQSFGKTSKTGTTGTWDVKATNRTVLSSEDFELSFRYDGPVSGARNSDMGLSNIPNPVPSGNFIDFDWRMSSSTACVILENGTSRAFLSHVLGDLFTIKALGTTLTFLQNGVIKYTSLVTRNMDLTVDHAYFNVTGTKDIKLEVFI